MLKLKMIIKVLLVLTISLCLHPIDNLFAGDCDDKGTEAGTPTVSGNYNYAPGHTCTKDTDMEYDTANSHETIDRNGSAALFVIGNNGPFTWSVSGVGFTLKTENEPTGPTNTLYADGSACGAATITVTGCDGEEVKGYVRCTTGGWGNQQDICGEVKNCALWYSCWITKGNIRTFYCKKCLCSDNCHSCEAYWTEAEACGDYAGAPGYCENWGGACGPCAGTPPGTGKAGLSVRTQEWICF